jgi:anti-anti-sigma regulatory factor
VSSSCGEYYLLVEPLANGFTVYPFGRLPYDGGWLLDERLLVAVSQLGRGCLYVDCARVTILPSEALANLLRLSGRVNVRDSRLIVCNLQPLILEFFREITSGPTSGEWPWFFDSHATEIPCCRTHATGLPKDRPRLLGPSCLAWNGGTVPQLARAIRDGRAYDRLPILADALEEAGCAHADTLNHCRQAGPHVPGCWALSLILGEG